MLILNANYRIWKNNSKQTVPAPVDPDTPTVDWWYDHIAKNAALYKQSGFTAILLPPPCKTQGGAANNADGYGKYDDYDIGSKNQCYSIPTRFGTAYQFRRCVAICHSVGLDVYTDVVLHQYDGGRGDGTYQYISSTGKTNGRFPKTASCFVGAPPRVPVDPVYESDGNYAFGDMCSYVNSTPPDYMASSAIAAGDWLCRTSGVDGLRIDDTKGSYPGFIHRYLTSGAMSKLWAFGECFDGNPNNLNYWVWNTGMNGRCSTVDFTVHWHLQTVCDNSGPASDLLQHGSAFFHYSPLKAVTYVESPDTDLSPGQQVISNKGLAYWFILCSEGAPLIYYRDYASDPYCYGLSKIINNLLWINSNLAFGTTINRHADNNVICFERQGYPGLLAAGNWDTWNRYTITVQTNFGPNVQLHDYTGAHSDIWTDWQGKATFTLPSNAYGAGTSFVCFSRTGYTQAFNLNGRSTTQTFFGDVDLDLPPAAPEATTFIGTVYCAANTTIKLKVNEGTGLTFSILGSGSEIVVYKKGSYIVNQTGDYNIQVTSVNTVLMPYEVEVTYTAPQELVL